ncbi:ABC transporter substrate-binding protein [Nocardiopsis potens]|uniref:ABC transporter substrate-binding protein n=1 Tax=Nocardiopsis potens TaxID=1246458 RepID=UPI000347EE5B|nr:ABC transporter substrate-binding protein [Nocardiopsis potens]
MKPLPLPLAATASTAVLLAACGSPTASAPEPPPGDTVTVQAANGEVEVAVTDEGIWALDVYTALNLAAVGAAPDHAARIHDGQGAREEIAAAAGAEIVGGHDPEAVADAAPSLIVGLDHPEHRSLLGLLEAIAPVVLIDEGTEVDELMEVIGAVTGRSAEAAEVADRFGAEASALAARIEEAGRTGRTVSVLQEYPPVFYAYDGGTQFAALLERVGLERPEAQSARSEWGFTEVSEERLEDHRADVVIALVDDVYGEGRSVLDNPMLDTSGAVTAEAEFSGWYNGDVLSAWWVLHDLQAVLIDGEATAGLADTPALWAETGGR